MRASSIIKALHYALFIIFIAVAIYRYQQLKILESQVQWVMDPFGNMVPGPGYEEVIIYKTKSLALLFPLLGGVFLTEHRFLKAISWLRERPNFKNNASIVKFITGLAIAIFIILYIYLTAKYLLVVRGLGL